MATKVFVTLSNLLLDRVHLQNLVLQANNSSSHNNKLINYHLKFLQNLVPGLPAKNELVISIMMRMIIWKTN